MAQNAGQQRLIDNIEGAEPEGADCQMERRGARAAGHNDIEIAWVSEEMADPRREPRFSRGTDAIGRPSWCRRRIGTDRDQHALGHARSGTRRSDDVGFDHRTLTAVERVERGSGTIRVTADDLVNAFREQKVGNSINHVVERVERRRHSGAVRASVAQHARAVEPAERKAVAHGARRKALRRTRRGNNRRRGQRSDRFDRGMRAEVMQLALGAIAEECAAAARGDAGRPRASRHCRPGRCAPGPEPAPARSPRSRACRSRPAPSRPRARGRAGPRRAPPPPRAGLHGRSSPSPRARRAAPPSGTGSRPRRKRPGVHRERGARTDPRRGRRRAARQASARAAGSFVSEFT